MTLEEAIALIEQLLERGSLTRVQELVFCQSWAGKTYLDMAVESDYDPGHIKDVGWQLWRSLSQVLGEKVTKNNLHGVLKRYVQNQQDASTSSTLKSQSVTNHTHWAEAINVSHFCGGTAELETLSQWILGDRCQLVAILGMGGIGKTSLAAKLTLEIQENFEYVIWHSLRNAPAIADTLTSLLQFFFCQRDRDSSHSIHSQISRLIHYLRSFRCLLILDNFGSIFKDGELAGTYQRGYEGYSKLLYRIAEEQHQSCLVLTSRDQPKELSPSETARTSMRSLYLSGLPAHEALKVLKSKGLNGSEDSQKQLVEIYRGNPLALKIVANCIHELFTGQVEGFLEQSTFVLIGIWSILDRQFNRLTEVEKLVMYWLAINREPTSLLELYKCIDSSISKRKLLEALESLLRRSLIEKRASGFTQQPLVMEYVNDYLTEKETLVKVTLNPYAERI
jgi:hypothetical protein